MAPATSWKSRNDPSIHSVVNWWLIAPLTFTISFLFTQMSVYTGGAAGRDVDSQPNGSHRLRGLGKAEQLNVRKERIWRHFSDSKSMALVTHSEWKNNESRLRKKKRDSEFFFVCLSVCAQCRSTVLDYFLPPDKVLLYSITLFIFFFFFCGVQDEELISIQRCATISGSAVYCQVSGSCHLRFFFFYFLKWFLDIYSRVHFK